MQKLLLHNWHEMHNAKFITLRGHYIPAHYGDVADEVHSALNSVVLTDRSYLGKLLLRGKDAFELLNLISTNDMNKLLGSMVCDTLFITPRGSLIDYCRILNLDSDFLLISSYTGSTHLQEWINRFITIEDVDVLDVSASFAWLTVLGPSSAEFIYLLSSGEVNSADETIWMTFEEEELPALKNDNLMVPAYNICVPFEIAERFIEWLTNKIVLAGGSLLGNDAFQIIRVESGAPDCDNELTEEFNAHEARLLNAVSFTKGSFTGQEVLAWLDTHDRVQRYLMIVDIHAGMSAEPPLNIFYNNENIGKLTSYAFDPLNERYVGLAYVMKSYAVDDFDLLVELQDGSRRMPASLRLPPKR